MMFEWAFLITVLIRIWYLRIIQESFKAMLQKQFYTIACNGDYVSDMPNATLIELDCGHFVHCFESERIAKEMKEFIDGLN